jgi:alpha-tubulin suppressor-like RCC1 family protein
MRLAVRQAGTDGIDGGRARPRVPHPPVRWRARAFVWPPVLIVAVAVAAFLAGAPASASAAEGNAALGWGENFFLELGAGYKDNSEESPVVSQPGSTNILSISAGDSDAMAILSGGGAISWGGNIYGQLGDGSHENLWEKQFELRPFEPAGLTHTTVMTNVGGEVTPLTNVVALVPTHAHSIALLKGGTVDAWGNDEWGQDGKGILNPERINPKGEKEFTMTGTSPTMAEPVEWEEGGEKHKLVNVVAIASGSESDSDYALVKSPTTGITSVWAWGNNEHGVLGLGTAGEAGGPEVCKGAEAGHPNCSTKPRLVEMPASVTSGERHIVAISAGAAFAVALLDDGSVLVWGSNAQGQLATKAIPSTGTENRVNHPIFVEGLKEKVTAIAAGTNHALALLAGGTVVGWGSNEKGQLGEEAGQLAETPSEECGKTVCLEKPTPVSWTDSEGTHELAGVEAVSAGNTYSLALKSGKVSSLGNNSTGALGLGDGGEQEVCREELEIKEKSGNVVNVNDNHVRCKGPEECVKLSEVGVSWQGEWSEKVEYGYGDGVEEAGVKYVSIKEPNHKHKPSETTKTWWEPVTESTGIKIHRELGSPCARHPHTVEGIGEVASISAGVWHAIAVLKHGVAAPAPIVTLTPENEQLKLAYRIPGRKGEYIVRAGAYNPEKPAAPEYKASLTFKNVFEPPFEEEKTQIFGNTEKEPLGVKPYVVQVRGCWPECALGVNPGKERLIGGTPLPPPPTVTGVAPTQGPTAGGTSVTISGTNLSGASEVKFGTVAATKLEVNSPTSITATAPSETAGTVDVTVTTRGGTSATGNADHYTYVPPPTVTNIEPNAGPPSGGTTVTITGTSLTGATSVRFGSVSATSFTVNSSTSITATAPEEPAGTVDVTVSTVGGTSATTGADHYNYAAQPTITKVEPSAGPTAGGNTVTITGTNLGGATGVHFGLTGATILSDSETTITVTAPAGMAGAVDVTVATMGGTSVTNPADQYTYVLAPTVTKVKPTVGPAGGGTTVTITGTNLSGATAVKFGSVNATSFTVVSETLITSTSPAQAPALVDVTVTTAGGTSATSTADRFHVEPVVTHVSPSSGPVAGGTTVTVTGEGFALGTTATKFKFGTTAGSSVNCAATTECTMISPAHETGVVDVRAIVNGQTSVKTTADLFTYS